jgi:hypothetical protein
MQLPADLKIAFSASFHEVSMGIYAQMEALYRNEVSCRSLSMLIAKNALDCQESTGRT